MKKIQIAALVLLLITAFITIDFGMNFLWALVPEANDGIGNFSVLHRLFGVFGNHAWSLSRYLRAFEVSIWITFVLLIVNVTVLRKKH